MAYAPQPNNPPTPPHPNTDTPAPTRQAGAAAPKPAHKAAKARERAEPDTLPPAEQHREPDAVVPPAAQQDQGPVRGAGGAAHAAHAAQAMHAAHAVRGRDGDEHTSGGQDENGDTSSVYTGPRSGGLRVDGGGGEGEAQGGKRRKLVGPYIAQYHSAKSMLASWCTGARVSHAGTAWPHRRNLCANSYALLCNLLPPCTQATEPGTDKDAAHPQAPLGPDATTPVRAELARMQRLLASGEATTARVTQVWLQGTHHIVCTLMAHGWRMHDTIVCVSMHGRLACMGASSMLHTHTCHVSLSSLVRKCHTFLYVWHPCWAYVLQPRMCLACVGGMSMLYTAT